MEGPGLDEDTAIIIAVSLIAAALLWFGVRAIRQGRMGVGIASLVGVAAFGFVAYFFATFQMRLF
jgi:hypothetical protein